MNLVTTIDVPAGGGYFEGHFPERPILPGVAEIAMCVEALERETREPLPLRGIAYARLRQVVLPGDRLELVARGLDDGRLRVDLKRGGVLVANGELIIGAPTPQEDTMSSAWTEVEPLSAMPPLDELLPHRPPMRFVQALLAETTDSLICTANIPAACALASGGAVPAVVGLEAAAQAAATWEALQRRRAGGTAAPRVGYLVALRDAVFFAERIPVDQALRVTVTLEAAALPLSHYRTELSLQGRPLTRGMIATFLKEEEIVHEAAGE